MTGTDKQAVLVEGTRRRYDWVVGRSFLLRGTWKSVPETMNVCTRPHFWKKGTGASSGTTPARALTPLGTHSLPAPHTYFSQRLQLGLHDELVLAELAAARVGALDPLLQAGLVHEVQAPRAVAGGDQRALVISFTVTDPRAAGKQSLWGDWLHAREGNTSVKVNTPKENFHRTSQN